MRQHARRATTHSRRRALLTVVAVLVVAAGGTAYAVRATEPAPRNPADVVAHPCPATRPFIVDAAPAKRSGAYKTLVPDRPAVATFCRYDQLTRPDGWKLRDTAEVRGDELAALVTALDGLPRGGSCPAIMHDNEMVGELYFEYPSGPGVELLFQGLLPTPDPCEHANNGAVSAYGTSKVALPLR